MRKQEDRIEPDLHKSVVGVLGESLGESLDASSSEPLVLDWGIRLELGTGRHRLMVAPEDKLESVG